MSEKRVIATQARPEFVRETLDASNIGEIVRPLSLAAANSVFQKS